MRKATFIFSDIINMSSLYKGFSHFLPGCLATLSRDRHIGKGCWRHTDEFVFLHRFLFEKKINLLCSPVAGVRWSGGSELNQHGEMAFLAGTQEASEHISQACSASRGKYPAS